MQARFAMDEMEGKAGTVSAVFANHNVKYMSYLLRRALPSSRSWD